VIDTVQINAEGEMKKSKEQSTEVKEAMVLDGDDNDYSAHSTSLE